MHVVEKSVLLRHSAAQMYELVDRVEDYPLFLPWCGGTEVRRDTAGMEATLRIQFKGVRHAFTTRNATWPGERIEMRLVEGPFSDLEGVWTFTALRADACKVRSNAALAASRALSCASHAVAAASGISGNTTHCTSWRRNDRFIWPRPAYSPTRAG